MIRFIVLLLAFFSTVAIAETQLPTTGVEPAEYQLFSRKVGVVTELTSDPVSADKLSQAFSDHCGRLSAQSGYPRHSTPSSMSSYGSGYCYLANLSFRVDVLIEHNVFCKTGTKSGQYPNAVCNGALKCPDSSWTLKNNVCERNVICQDGYSLDNDGICRKNCTGLQTRVDGEDCACRPNNVSLTNRVGMSVFGDGSIPDIVCYDDCEFRTGEAVGGGGMWFGLLSQPTFKKCNGTAPDADMPPREEPPCKATEGVMTSSSGTVACVPEGTPTARKPQVKESKTKQQFPDGSVKEVKKVDTKDPATGATHSSTTSTSTGGQSGPAGETKETSSSSSSTSGGSGGGGGEGDEPGQCAKEPESPTCKKGEVKKKGEFGDDSMQNDIQDAKDRYKQLINNISGEIGNMFDLSLSGGGSLPCPPPVNVMGASFGICFADYSESLSIIGLGILFIAAILSAFIILRK